VLDGARRDGGKKCFFVLLALQSGSEIFDLGFERSLADVLERRIAKNPFDVVATMISASAEIIAELG